MVGCAVSSALTIETRQSWDSLLSLRTHGPTGPRVSLLARVTFRSLETYQTPQHKYKLKETGLLSLQPVEHLRLAAPVAEFDLTPAFTVQWHSRKAVGGQGWMAPHKSVQATSGSARLSGQLFV